MRSIAILMTTFLCMNASHAVTFLLDDFNTNKTAIGRSMEYEDIALGSWSSSSGNTSDWVVQNGRLEQVGRANSSIRAARVFEFDFSGASNGWAIEFDIFGGLEFTPPVGLNSDFDVWIGKDDGNNLANDDLWNNRQDTQQPNVGIVEDSMPNDTWVHVFSEGWNGNLLTVTPISGGGSRVKAFFHTDSDEVNDPAPDPQGDVPTTPVDATLYDLVAIRFQSSNLASNYMNIDNLSLSNENITAPTNPNGDYNDDGTVDLADYTLWRNSVGETSTLPNDPDVGNTVGTDQYNTWRTNFGAMAPSIGGISSTVPEPSSIAMLVSIGALAWLRLRRQ